MIYKSNFIKGHYHNIEKMTSQIFGPDRSKRHKSEPNPTLPLALQPPLHDFAIIVVIVCVVAACALTYLHVLFCMSAAVGLK